MIKAKEKPMKTGMREIKFRGKRIDNGEWVYGHYFLGVPSPLDENKQRHYIAPPLGLGDEVDPASVGQFTGLKDSKNGREIYEGDVCKYLMDGVWNYGYVFWDQGGFALKVFRMGQTFIPVPDDGETMTDRFEVIGNIHDNPELIEGTLIEGTGNQDEGDSWEERQGDHDD